MPQICFKVCLISLIFYVGRQDLYEQAQMSKEKQEIVTAQHQCSSPSGNKSDEEDNGMLNVENEASKIMQQKCSPW